MLKTPHPPSAEMSELVKYVIQSSDVIEDLRVYVRDESSEKIHWYKERFLTDEEIIENIVENETSKLCWTIHRPKRGWYIRMRAPSFPPGSSIALTPAPASSPFHVEAALTFSTRTNPPKYATASPSSLKSASPEQPSLPTLGKTDSPTTESDVTSVHSYPPTPSAELMTNPILSPPPYTLNVRPNPKTPRRTANLAPPEIRSFLLAPHSVPHVPPPGGTSFLTKALSVFQNNKPSHSLSFTLCPLPEASQSPQSLPLTHSPSQTEAKRLSQDKSHTGHHHRLDDLKPPSPPALITFHDRTPLWNFRSNTGLLEIDAALERELGVDRSFWITIALAYMEFLTERESYLAAAGG